MICMSPQNYSIKCKKNYTHAEIKQKYTPLTLPCSSWKENVFNQCTHRHLFQPFTGSMSISYLVRKRKSFSCSNHLNTFGNHHRNPSFLFDWQLLDHLNPARQLVRSKYLCLITFCKIIEFFSNFLFYSSPSGEQIC